MKGFAHWEIYDCMFALPMTSARGNQDDSSSSPSYRCPKYFVLFCSRCGCGMAHNFTPVNFDSGLKVLSGLLRCDGDLCKSNPVNYRVWLMNPNEKATVAIRDKRVVTGWGAAWMTPKPGESDPSDLCQYIPEEYSVISQNYQEAKKILNISYRASGALTRLALEALISEKLGIRERNLSKDIQKIIELGIIPSGLLDEDDFRAIKDIGDISVHIFKNKETKAVIEVTYQDVVLALDILEDLLDYCFARPARRKAHKQELKQKIQSGEF